MTFLASILVITSVRQSLMRTNVISHANIGLDFEGIKKLIEGLAPKGMVDIEETQSNQVEAQINLVVESSAKAQREEDVAEKRIRVSSRNTKMPAWMVDFV